jgi:hypothetical protein
MCKQGPYPEPCDSNLLTRLLILLSFNYWGVHPVARVSSNVNKPPYTTTFFGARFYCALTLHVSVPDRGPSSGDM